MDIVPTSELQIDIFVTNVKPVPPPKRAPAPTRISFVPPPKPTEKNVELEPPHPVFVQEASPRSSISSEDSGEDTDVDLSYYTGGYEEEGELGHEEHILDLTNFEGDNDTALPGEAQFNLSVKQEGRARRRNTRRMTMAVMAKHELIYKATELQYDSPGQSSSQLVRASLPPINTDASSSPRRPNLDINITDVPLSPRGPLTPITATPMTATPNSAHPLIDPFRDTGMSSPRHSRNLSALGYGAGASTPASRRVSQALSEQSVDTPITPASRFGSRSRLSVWTDTDSFAALVPSGDVEAVREQLRLDLDDTEVDDVGIVAERARPGKPKLDRILADEVERAKGAVAVACEYPRCVMCAAAGDLLTRVLGCGPTSLDAMIRKVIAAQINPGRIRRGDMRGSITLFSEEFSY